ncbi:MAG TPA: SRPBCC family protein [Burkholderiales bacterium]|nr:SRPBCC family protein [Burkholderiales bacterium]
MAHRTLRFVMPAPSAAAFEAFFNHSERLRWDTLLDVSYVEAGGTHPSVGVITSNEGRGWKRALSMRTRFLTYKPPHQASAVLVAPMGPFASWGASMRFADRSDGQCELVYTFTLHMRPAWLRWLLDPIAGFLFARETRQRFHAMAAFLRARCDGRPA